MKKFNHTLKVQVTHKGFKAWIDGKLVNTTLTPAIVKGLHDLEVAINRPAVLAMSRKWDKQRRKK
jgi:hypothetical protein